MNERTANELRYGCLTKKLANGMKKIDTRMHKWIVLINGKPSVIFESLPPPPPFRKVAFIMPDMAGTRGSPGFFCRCAIP
jgi:hypothetical protein